MAMKKYGDAQKAKVFSGREATILNQHLRRHGKALEDFTEKQKEALYEDLESVRESEDEESEE